jgi:hypothetical protein
MNEVIPSPERCPKLGILASEMDPVPDFFLAGYLKFVGSDKTR